VKRPTGEHGPLRNCPEGMIRIRGDSAADRGIGDPDHAVIDFFDPM
jgi:hypothetical protein